MEISRVDVILQVDDVQNAQLTSLLERNHVVIKDRMAGLGSLRIRFRQRNRRARSKRTLPTTLSPNRQIESFGHIPRRRLAHDQIRQSTSLVGLLLQALTLDGSGVGVAMPLIPVSTPAT